MNIRLYVCLLNILLLQAMDLRATVYTVGNANDSGPGSLRQAIIDANTTATKDTINFSSPFLITLLTRLPDITQPVFINGLYSSGPQIEINGNTNNVSGAGLLVDGNASGTVIRGLNIHGHTGQGILIVVSNVNVSGCYIGTDITGSIARANGVSGIELASGISNIQIGGGSPDSMNVISGNGAMGINVAGGTSNIIIIGNIIGLGADGVTSIPNGSHGISLLGATNCIIGGAIKAYKNVISSNGSSGILLDNCTNVSIKGNFIGTDKTGTVKRGNSSHGVQLQTKVSGIVIGGSRYKDGNIISCNGGSGINFQDPNTGQLQADGTIIKGNLIGTDSTSTLNFGNFVIGIILKSNNCIIGDTANNEGNVLVGTQLFCGLLIANGNNNIVKGNYIGVGLNGTTAIPNTKDGLIISVENSGLTANKNIVEYNTIAYNTRFGVNVGAALNNFSSNQEIGNVIRFNKIYCNTSLGISLNLSNAADKGNNGNKAPQINFVKTTPNKIVGATDPAIANQKVDLYLVIDCPNCDINPQGKVWLDSLIVSATGAWSYDYTAKFGIAIPGEIVATATDNAGNTSEFSKCCFAVHGTSLTSSVNPVCPGNTFNITYSNGQGGDSLMLQVRSDLVSGPWTNLQAVKLTDPVTFTNLTIADTSYFRVVTFSSGDFNNANCKDSSQILTVNLNKTPTAGVATISPDSICNGDKFVITLTGNVGNIQWQKSVANGSFNDIPLATTNTIQDSPTDKDSPVFYRAVVSNSNCPSAISNSVKGVIINVNPGTIKGTSQVCNGAPVALSLTGYTGNIQWQDSLKNGSWLNISGATSSLLSYTPSATKTQDYIRVVVSGPSGKCKAYSSFTVNSDTCMAAQPIQFPNALTPNGDGSNDVFYIGNIWLYPNNHLIIYNRWGNKVYEATGYFNQWDGTRDGELLPQATYYYVLEAGTDINGNALPENKYEGSVTIVR